MECTKTLAYQVFEGRIFAEEQIPSDDLNLKHKSKVGYKIRTRVSDPRPHSAGDESKR